jgi:uncharacterized membrane protein
MLDALVVVTLVVVGVMVGVEFAVAVFVNPILNRLPSESGLAARGDGARVLGKVMPVWYIASTVLAAVWAALTWGQAQAPEVVGGVALLVATVVLSLVVLVPISARAAGWKTEGVPADWNQQVTRWDRFHYVRVAAIVGAFALFVIAGVR